MLYEPEPLHILIPQAATDRTAKDQTYIHTRAAVPLSYEKKGEMNEQKRMIERLKKYTIPVARVFLVSRFDFQSLCVGKEFMC